eukprot:5418205-Pyramimonas_sp.AAC.1
MTARACNATVRRGGKRGRTTHAQQVSCTTTVSFPSQGSGRFETAKETVPVAACGGFVQETVLVEACSLKPVLVEASSG